MKTVFAKYNRERLPKYQIVTKIVEDNNKKRYAIKEPLCEEAQEHINTIYKNYELLKSNYDINLVKPTKVESGILFEMAEGSSLENILLHAIYNNDEEKFQKYINKFLNLLDSMVYKRDVMFEPSKEFEEVFGRWNIDEPQDIIKVANIDMIFGNIFVNEKDEFTFIDYEWVYDFEVPKSFIIWRSLNVFYFSFLEDMNLFEGRNYFQKLLNTDCYINEQAFYDFIFSKKRLFFISKEKQKVSQSLKVKEDELHQTQVALQSKEDELHQTQVALQSKEDELHQTQVALQSKEDELCMIRVELTNIYISKSWEITRPFRKIMRKIRK